MKVRKRDGRLVNFNESKIINAIQLASDNMKSDNKITDKQLKNTVSFVKSSFEEKDKDIVDVDDVHYLVEKSLRKENKDVAKSYIDYRKERDLNRYKNMPLTKQRLSKVDGKNNDRQNANLDGICFSGRKSESHSVEDKEDALNFYMSPRFAKLHRDNIFYIHDLDSFTVGEHNCLSYPIDDSSRRRTIIKNSDLRVAGRISSALSNSCVYLQVQSQEQFGGVSLTHLDTSMVVYLRKSFYKYYKKYMKNLKHRKFKLDDYENISIDSNVYKNWWNKKVYKYALEDTIEECNQSMEAFFHNLNSLLSRSGGQLPFTSINFGKDTTTEGRIINESIHKISMEGIGEYGRTSIFPCQIFQLDDEVNAYKGTPNYDLFKDAIESTANRLYPNYANCQWSVQLKGLKKDRAIKRKVIHDIFENDKNLYNELLQFIKDYPNESLKMNLEIKNNGISVTDKVYPTEDFSTMGCRTNNGFDINFDENYFKSLIIETLKQKQIPINYLTSAMQRDGRGNICPCTIILPTIAMLAKKKSEKNESNIIDEFMKLLEKHIEDCKDELIERFNFIASQSAESAPFMYTNNTMKGYIEEEGIVSALKHGTLAIGQIGLAETLQILVGCDQCEEKGMNLAKKIEQLFADKCEEYKNKYKLNFGVYYTPAENLARTSYLKFKDKYGLIENVTAYKNEKGELIERGYFTNSIHVPVWKKISPFKKIDIESQLTSYSSAGCITYVELDEYAPNNLKAIEDIIIYAKKKDIPYFAINIPLDFCTKCGYRGVIKGNCCPNCGAKEYEEIKDEKGNIIKKILTKFIERLRRVTGYLTGNYRVAFNDGKQMETDDREKHSNYMDDWSHN